MGELLRHDVVPVRCDYVTVPSWAPAQLTQPATAPCKTGHCPEIRNLRSSKAKRAEKATGMLTERQRIHAQRQSLTVQGYR